MQLLDADLRAKHLAYRFDKEIMDNLCKGNFFERFMPSPILDRLGNNYPSQAERYGESGVIKWVGNNG